MFKWLWKNKLVPWCCKSRGNSMVLSVGLISSGLIFGPIAIDIPVYFAAHTQLQNAVDAAALAGAAALPEGQTEAKAAAYSVAALNPVAGHTLESSDLQYTFNGSSMTVSGSTHVDTVTSKILCGMVVTFKPHNPNEEEQPSEGETEVVDHCDSNIVRAFAKAVPAARDTMMVLDTSSSMNDLGNNRPFTDVKNSANKYLDQLIALNSQSIDKVGLVKFDQTGAKKSGLTSKVDSPNFSSVRSAISGLSLFSGSGWNTNYEAGLKLALDELETNGRKNSDKIVLFFTDGYPNLPGPPSYYGYSASQPIKKCTDMVDNSAAVKSLCYWSGGKKICPTLPSSKIPDSMISSAATQCGQDYVNHMISVTSSQTDRAKNLGATIYTIEIRYDFDSSTSISVLRRLLKNSEWEPPLLQYMAETTKGENYVASAYNAAEITALFEQVAKDIKIKLST